MKKVVTPFKVGLLVIAAGVAFMFFFTFVRKSNLDGKEAITVYALFKDASGLGSKSRVQIAGIPVGEIADIRLEGTHARVTLRIRRQISLRENASLSKRSESMLGDYLIDLTPGSEDAPPMPEGGQIKLVHDKTGMDQTLEQLNSITSDVQQVTRSLREVLGGEKGAGSLHAIMDNLVKISGGLDETIHQSGVKLDKVLSNFEKFSVDISGMTAGQSGNYRQIIANVREITEDAKGVLQTVKHVLGSNGGDLKSSVVSFQQTMNRLDESLKNIESVTAKIDRGEGTLGKLINDSETGEHIQDTVADASDYVGRMMRIMTEVTLRSEYNFNQQSAKNYLRLRIIPKPDKYYLLEVVDDPRGVTEEETIQRDPPGENQLQRQTVLTTKQDLKFSAQIAKRYYFLTLRFGLIESSGGVGANLHFLSDNLSLNVDLFEITSRDKEYPRLKAYVNYAFLGHLFFTVGVDDIFNPKEKGHRGASNALTQVSGRDFFVGGGIYFTDDDLKAILSSVPIP